MDVWAYSNRFQSVEHGPQFEGFETHARVETALEALESISGVTLLPAREAFCAELLLVHSVDHLRLIKSAVEKSRDIGEPVDAFEQVRIYPGTWEACASMAGACLDAVTNCASHNRARVWVIGRTPGHHALDLLPMGYCLLSNAALAAQYALQHHGLRTAVVDFDVHRGNGTDAALANKPGVFLGDIFLRGGQQYPDEHEFPGSAPSTPNVVKLGLPPGTSGREYLRVFRHAILPKISDFSPDLIVCSAGLDCLAGDPLGGFLLGPADLASLTQDLLSISNRTLFILEGGYNLKNLADGVAEITDVFREG